MVNEASGFPGVDRFFRISKSHKDIAEDEYETDRVARIASSKFLADLLLRNLHAFSCVW